MDPSRWGLSQVDHAHFSEGGSCPCKGGCKVRSCLSFTTLAVFIFPLTVSGEGFANEVNPVVLGSGELEDASVFEGSGALDVSVAVADVAGNGSVWESVGGHGVSSFFPSVTDVVARSRACV